MMEVKCSMLIYLRASQSYVQIEETMFLEPFPHGWKISRRWKRCQFKLCCDLINTCFHSSDSTTLVTWKCWLSSAEWKMENMRQVALFFSPWIHIAVPQTCPCSKLLMQERDNHTTYICNSHTKCTGTRVEKACILCIHGKNNDKATQKFKKPHCWQLKGQKTSFLLPQRSHACAWWNCGH